MLERRIHSVLELLDMAVLLHRSIQSVFEVDWNGCYNIASRASGKWIEMDVMLQRSIHSVLELLDMDVPT